MTPEKIRNIAVVAHIDHGKTTLLDSLLKQSKAFQDHQVIPDRVMDSYDQERERGITIFSKQSAVYFDDHKINIIDTPGHADFSAEVERVLGMVDSVLLLVDACEGPMPQTRFVLAKSLKMGLRPIVVLNKIDRPQADPDRALDLTFDLFVELGATDEQLDFPHVYASGVAGYAMHDINGPRDSLDPLLEMVVKHVPPPKGEPDSPFLMQVATITYDDYLGRMACGRIIQGNIRKGQSVTRSGEHGKVNFQVTRVQGVAGLQVIDLEEGYTGDIVTIAGLPDIRIGDTLSDPREVNTLPAIPIEEPIVSVDFLINSSPMVGRDGAHVTMNKLRDRLEREKRANISLNIDLDTAGQERITVVGRGELHLSVLIEAMRREGYELSVSRPKVVTKEQDGAKLEPMERVRVEVPEEFSGVVIEDLSRRKGEMQSLDTTDQGITQMEFIVPMRGLIGYQNDFLTVTKGLGILTSIFDSFAPWRGEVPTRSRGVLISMCSGKATPYALFNLQSRGELFVAPGDDVYEGMIVGEHSRENDLVVNVTRAKQLTNVRASGKDDTVILTPPRRYGLEQAISYIASDELVEVTPNHIRFRKIFLTENERKRAR